MNRRYSADVHHRQSIRLRHHDYTEPGAYFVTICTKDRECLFGAVDGDEIRLNDYGQIAQGCWGDLTLHFPNVQLDAFTVMPNHIHGVVLIASRSVVGATHASPLPVPPGPRPASLGAIIGSFKSAVTKRINVARSTPGLPVWQRNYYEHVVRGDHDLHAIREYICQNPSRWAEDPDNPSNPRRERKSKDGNPTTRRRGDACVAPTE